MLSGRALEEAADRCQADIQRDEARHAEDGTVVEARGLLLCRGAGRLPVTPNTAMILDTVDPDDLFDRADTFFGERQAGYTLHLRLGDVDDHLVEPAQARQPLFLIDAPAMIVRHPLEHAGALGADVTLQTVVDPTGTAAYAEVVDDAYQSLGWPAGGPATLFASPDLLLKANKVAFVAYVDGTPAAGASVSVTDGLGLVSWVGTTVAARGRGLGRAVTVAATNAGFELGASDVWLAASEMGAPLYRDMGYEDFARSRGFVLWPGL